MPAVDPVALAVIALVTTLERPHEPPPPSHLEVGSTRDFANFPSARVRIFKSAALRDNPRTPWHIMRTILRLRPEVAW